MSPNEPKGSNDISSPSKGVATGSSSSTTSSLRSRIAAFETGAAANASKAGGGERERERASFVPHADLSNLRSRFDREGDKPLVVKGSFGLGAPPPSSTSDRHLFPSEGGARAVSLGSGRAVSPLQSPSVVLPIPSAASTGSSASSSTGTRSVSGTGATAPHAVRPHSLRSDSTTSTASTTNTTQSSLLAGPVAALVNSSTSSAATTPDATGLRTPMSSLSLSSLQVESGSVLDDSGENTANEDEGDQENDGAAGLAEAAKITGGGEVSDSPEATDDNAVDGKQVLQDQEDLSAADMEKHHHLTTKGAGTQAASSLPVASEEADDENPVTIATPEPVAPPRDAVERAAEELEKYSLEEPSAATLPSTSSSESADVKQAEVPKSDSLPQVAIEESAADEESAAAEHTRESSPAPASPVHDKTGDDEEGTPSSVAVVGESAMPPSRRPISRPLSISSPSRLRRSSTANSIASIASHPESDLADTKLQDFDGDVEGAAMADSTKGTSPLAKEADGDKDADAANAEANASGTSEASDAAGQPRVDDSDKEVAVDDAAGMPKVKCSDCGVLVPLMDLGEHVCAPPASATLLSTATTTATEEPMQTSDDKGAKPDPLLGEDDGTARESNVTEAVNGDAAVESEAKPEQHDQVDLLRGRRAEPEDVPTDDLSPSPFASPAPAGPEELPPVASRHEEGSHPDVPDDEAMSIGGESAAHIPNEGTADSHPQEEIEEEEYMTALTSRRDSIEGTAVTRPARSRSGSAAEVTRATTVGAGAGNLPVTPSSSMQNLDGVAAGEAGTDETSSASPLSRTMHTPSSGDPAEENENDEDDETEELASFVTQQNDDAVPGSLNPSSSSTTAINNAETPKSSSFAAAGSAPKAHHPDSPTPDRSAHAVPRSPSLSSPTSPSSNINTPLVANSGLSIAADAQLDDAVPEEGETGTVTILRSP